MSTTFEVHPSTTRVPTVGEVLEAGEREIASVLARRGLHTTVRLQARLGPAPRWRRELKVLGGDRPFWCREDQYLWLTIDGVDGGTDVHVHDNEFVELDEAPRAADFEDVGRYTATGSHWSFRRSVGQPGVVNLAYGLLAGCLARLVDGLVHSDDGAWEWERMPMRPDELLAGYFVPERTGDPQKAEWARRCLCGVAEDVGIPLAELTHGLHEYAAGDPEERAAQLAREGWRVLRIPGEVAPESVRELEDTRIAVVWVGPQMKEVMTPQEFEAATTGQIDLIAALEPRDDQLVVILS